MNNKKVITKTRLEPKDYSNKESSMDNRQEFFFVGKICRFCSTGLQVQKGKTKSWFWFNNETGTDLSQHFKVGDEVKMQIVFKTYINKDNEYTTRTFVKDMELLDSEESYKYDFNQPKCVMKANVVKVTKTDIKGLFVLDAIRLDSQGKEQEQYHIRYYNRNITSLDLGKYEIDFDLYNSSRIIQANGEIYLKEEEMTAKDNMTDETETLDEPEEEPVKKRVIFVPYLEANGMYLIVESA